MEICFVRGLYFCSFANSIAPLNTEDGPNGLECYADADFAGVWCKEDADQVGSVLSRTGYIIKFVNSPIVWVSKMQTEIALSTTEAENICLSQSKIHLIFLT